MDLDLTEVAPYPAGGIMMAVCLLELWPEAKKCKSDWRAWHWERSSWVPLSVQSFSS
jgi:hypothetical protein